MAGWFIGGAGDRFTSTMLTAGVDWLSADGKTTNFDRPEATEIMTWWKQLYDEKLLDIPKENARDLFIAQKCAYFMDSSGNAVGFTNLVKDFKWDVSLPPQAAAGGTVTETYGPVTVIPKTDAEKQLAGWLWLKWLSTPAPLASWITATSYFPSTKVAAEGPALKEFYAKNAPAAKALREIAPNARILTPSPALTQVRGQIVADAVNQVLLAHLATSCLTHMDRSAGSRSPRSQNAAATDRCPNAHEHLARKWGCPIATALPHIRCLRFCHRDLDANNRPTIVRWRRSPFPGHPRTIFVSLDN